MKADRHSVALDINALLGSPESLAAPATTGAGEPCPDAPPLELRLHYQPVIDLPSGALIALRAAPQWEHPQLGTLSPRRFLPLILAGARASDYFTATLRCACLDLRRWDNAGHSGLRVDIDLIASQYFDEQLPARITALLAQMEIAPARICLQIPESLLALQQAANPVRLAQLRQTGVGLALGEFGTGALTGEAALALPFNSINIGALFVQDMVALADDAAMAQELFSNAHRHGLRIGADGIETATEFELLRSAGCDEMQGPYFLRAQTAAEIDKLLPQRANFSDLVLLPQKPRRALLLVDDEPNILSALRRLLRSDQYEIKTAGDGPSALALLEQHRFDVIVCDQRMPDMSGVEFFGIAKQRCPDTVRIILSGYTELQSVIDAVNEGAIYKFLCKPWDDVQLRGHIAEAFARKEMADDNERLHREVHAANQRLMLANRQMESLLDQQQQQIQSDEVSLQIVREALHHMPLPVIGVDDDQMAVLVNPAAQALLGGRAVLGDDIGQLLPSLPDASGRDSQCQIELDGTRYLVKAHSMGDASLSRGTLLIFSQITDCS